MSRLESARDRLEQAVAKLEAAADSRQGDGRDPDALADALDAARQENVAMHEATEAVGTRLDRVIGRLRSILDG